MLVGVGYYYKQKKSVSNIYPAVTDEVFYGELKSIASDSLEVNLTTQAPFEDKPTVIKKVFILELSTEYLRETQIVKSEEQFKNEEKKFRDIASTSGVVVAPGWLKNEKITSKDIKIGDKLRVIYFNKNGRLMASQILLLNPIKGKELNSSEMLKATESKIDGTVILVDGQKLKLDICQALINASSSCQQKEKIISISEKTRIIRKKIKTESEFKKEQADFRDKLIGAAETSDGNFSLSAPDWYNQIDGKISDLKPGMKISVAFINGDSDSISASAIYYQ